MTPVVNFPGEKTAEGRNAAGDERIIGVLQDVLHRARDGDISAVAVAYVENDGSTHEVWAAPWRETHLLAAITLLHHRYTDAELSRSTAL